MAVAVNPDFSDRSDSLERLDDSVEQLFADLRIALLDARRQQLGVEDLLARLDAEPLISQARARSERLPGADLVDPRQGAPQDLPGLERIQLRRPAAHPRKGCKAKAAEIEQGASVDDHWGGHRQLGGRQLRRELVLFLDLGIRPALRPIELQHQVAGRAAELVDPVLVAVERKQAAVGLQPDRGSGIQHHIG